MSTSRWLVTCHMLVVLGIGMVGLRAEDKPPAEAVPQLAVSIAVPLVDGVRPIFVTGSDAHFHVVLRNPSQAPVRVWQGGNSWGDSALHFELTDAAGRTRDVRRRAVPYLQNAPVWQTLSPGGMFVIDVHFDRDEWESFPLPGKGEELSVTLKAIYNVASDQAAQKSNVWTGNISSPPEKFRFENRR